MKLFTQTFLILFVINSFSYVVAQTTVQNKSVVRTSENLITKTDSTGTHYITTVKKDSTVGDSIYMIKTVRDKIVTFKEGSKVTTEKTYTTVVKAKKY